MNHIKIGYAFPNRRNHAPEIDTQDKQTDCESAINNIIAPGARLELLLDTLVPGGRALARKEGLPVIFVDKGVPGQLVTAEVTNVKASHIQARRIKVLRKATNEINPFCAHFSSCGGCSWQEIPYADQLSWKRAHLQETLRRIGGIDFPVPELIPSPLQTGFRNKMEFAFGFSKDEDITLGLRKRDSREIEEIHECPVATPGMMPIVTMVREFAKHSGLPAWDEAKNSGFWRFLVIRSAGTPNFAPIPDFEKTSVYDAAPSSTFMVHIITGTPDQLLGSCKSRSNPKRVRQTSSKNTEWPQHVSEKLKELARRLREQFPGIRSVLHGVRTHPAPFAIASQITILSGEAALHESINGLSLSMSGDAFFQTNPGVTPLLHATIKNMAQLSGTEHVLDLFCGTGAIGLSLANSCRKVTGIESVPGAAQDAAENARMNNITNAVFFADDAVLFMKKAVSAHDNNIAPDVIVADPPRAGLGKEIIKAILAANPLKLILVSCDMAAMARDLALLNKGGYVLQKIQALDMFPHTPHMECCCLLQRIQAHGVEK